MHEPSRRLAIASLMLGVVAFTACRKSVESHADQRTATTTPSTDVSVAAEPLPKETKAPTAESPAPVDKAKTVQEKTEKPGPEKLDDLRIYTAAFMAGEYGENKIRADARFENSRLIVSGEVDHVGEDVLGNPYVILTGSGGRSVHCEFTGAKAASLVNLSSGESVSVVGTCTGLNLGDVYLKDCRLTEYYPPEKEGQTYGEQIAATVARIKNFHPNSGPTYEEIKAKREKAEAAKAAAERLAAEKAAEEAKYRKWASANGTFTTDAKLLSYSNGAITIQTREGKKVNVPLEKLSKEDQDFVAKWRKQH